MKRIVVSVLSAVGLLTLLLSVAGVAAYLYLGSGADVKIKQTLSSPDGSYVATVHWKHGGGGLGSCAFGVSVNASHAPFSAAKDAETGEGAVYSGTCGIEPEIRWAEPLVLEVTLAEFMQSDWTSGSFKGTDDTRKVRIVFRFTRTASQT